MIGVAIITCDRPDFFENCFKSIPMDEIDHLLVVDDGNEPVSVKETEKIMFCRSKQPRRGVGASKHKAIDVLMKLGCNHVFLIEDDIVITKPGVFDRYIMAGEKTGIQHFMFGYHGPANKNGISGGSPVARYRYQLGSYDNGDPLTIAINQHCVGAFCYYTREAIEKVGNFDLDFHNAFEHIEHSHRIAEAGLTTGYWNWADIADSTNYLAELACSEDNSSIRGREDWSDNIKNGIELFIKKHGQHPFSVKDTSENDIRSTLKRLSLHGK